MIKKLYNKTAVASRRLARQFFLLEKGMRIPSVSDLQKDLGFSRGTVQNGLRYLQEQEAITTVNKGHLGTYLSNIDYSKLQNIGDIERLKGTMPLPYSKKYEGLATSLYLLFQKQNIRLNMAYIRGSEERIRAVEEGYYNFACVSRFAAERIQARNKNIEIFQMFGEKSYLTGHVLLFSDSDYMSIEDGMRVGVDYDSLDHTILTKEAVKNKNIQLIDVPSNQLIFSLKEKQIEAAIWNYDEIVDKQIEGLNLKTLPQKEHHKLMSEAVLISRTDDKITQKLCKKYIQIAEVKEIQNKIKENHMTPRY